MAEKVAKKKSPIEFQEKVENLFSEHKIELKNIDQTEETSKIILEESYYPDDKTLSFFAKFVYVIGEEEKSLEKDREQTLPKLWDIVRDEIINNPKTEEGSRVKKHEEKKEGDKKTIKYDESIKVKEWIENLRRSWDLFTWVKNPDDGYFGAAFWNLEKRQLVISHRGTDFRFTGWQSVITDIQGIINSENTYQIHSACTFSALVIKEFKKKYQHVSISFTGHSLGAWLAPITAFVSEYLEFREEEQKEIKIDEKIEEKKLKELEKTEMKNKEQNEKEKSGTFTKTKWWNFFVVKEIVEGVKEVEIKEEDTKKEETGMEITSKKEVANEGKKIKEEDTKKHETKMEITSKKDAVEEIEKKRNLHKTFCKELSISSNSWTHIHTVVFDAPGCYEKLCQISEASGYLRYNEDAHYLIAALDITIYFNTPNIVNSLNSHKGISRLLQIYKADDERKDFLETVPKNLKFYDINTHSMINFNRMLIQPGKTQIISVWDWPSYFFPRVNRTKTPRGEIKMLSSVSEVVNTALKGIKVFWTQSVDNEFLEFIQRYELLRYNLKVDKGNLDIHYYAEKIDVNSRISAIFTKKEWRFLENWNTLKKEYSKLNYLKPFLRSHFQQLQTHEIFLPEFELTEKNNKKIINCFEKKDVNTIINRTKHVLLFLPDIYVQAKTDAEALEGTIVALLEDRSKKYVENNLPCWGVDFQGSSELADFLNNLETRENLRILITERDTKEQVFIIRNILERASKKACYLSLTDLNELNEVRDVVKAFKDKNCHVNDILVVDCDSDSSDLGVLNELVQVARNEIDFPKKLIIVKKIEQDDPQLFQDITKISASLLFADLNKSSQNELLSKKIFYLYSKEICMKNIFNVSNADGLSSDQINYLSQTNVLRTLIEASEPIQVNSEYTTHHDDLKVSTYETNEDIFTTEFSNFWDKNKKFGKPVLFFITGDLSNIDTNVKDLICNNDSAEENSSTFYNLCRNNLERRIYWLHSFRNRFELKQIFDNDFYIERQLYYETVFKKDFVDSLSRLNSTFIFCDDEMYSLSTILRLKNIDFEHSSHEDAESKTFDGRSIIMTTNMETALALSGNVRNRSVHVIRATGNKLVWIRSKGSFEDIRDHVHVGDSTLSAMKCLGDKRDKALQYHDTKATIIADESGMGKSTILLELSKHLKDHWVIRINLINFRKSLHQIPSEAQLCIESIIEFLTLSNNKLSSPFVKVMLKYSLSNEKSVPVAFLFDGFDEITDENFQIRLSLMFQYLKEHTSTGVRIYITTKLWARKVLEDKLSVFSLRIKEIREDEQKYFIEKFWTSRLCLLHDVDSVIRELNPKVVELFRRKDLLIFKYPISSQVKAKLEKELNRYMQLVSEKELNLILEHLPNMFSEVQRNCGKLKKSIQVFFENINILNSKLTDVVSFFWSLSKAENLFCQNNLKNCYEAGNDKVQRMIKILLVSFENLKEETEDLCNRDVLGMPLQLRMLATVLQPHFDEIKSVQFPKTLRELYQTFVTLKFKNHIKKKFDRSNSQLREELLNLLLDKHKCLAFQLLFPDKAADYLKREEILDLGKVSRNEIVIDVKNLNIEGFLRQRSMIDVNLIGIVEVFPSGEYRFIHNTVAEFFAIGKILDLLKKEPRSPALEDLLVKEILLKNEYKTMRQFLNDQLAAEPATESLLNFLGATISKHVNNNFANLVSANSESCLHICVSENLVKLATLLLKSFRGFERNLISFIDVKNDDHETAIHYPAFNDQLELATLLIKSEPKENVLHFTPREWQKFDELVPETDVNFDQVIVNFSKRSISVYFLRNSVAIKSSTYISNCLESHQILEIVKTCDDVRNLSVSSMNTLSLFAAHINARDKMNEIFLKRHPGLELYDISKHIINEPIARLYLAASNGDSEMVHILLNENVRTDYVDECSGETPLLAAARCERWHIVTKLIERNANVDAIDKYYRSTLHYAVRCNKLEIIGQLLEKNVDLNIVDIETKSTPLGIAASNDYWDVVEVLLRHGPDVNIKIGDKEITVLHLAAQAGKRQIVLKLLEAKACIDEVENINGCTPMLVAANWKKWDVVREFIRHGANVDVTDRENRNTVLQLAIVHEQFDIVLEIIERTKKIEGYSNSRLHRPLILTACKKYWKIFSKLMDRKADVNMPCPETGFSVLHFAAADGQIGIVRRLLKNGANINAVNLDNVTPLYKAASERQWDVVLALIENNADVNIADINSKTVLHLAAEKNKIEVVKKLIEKRATIDARTVPHNFTPMCAAALDYNWDIVLELLNANANPNIQLSVNNETVLYIAAVQGQVRIVKKLIEKGANIDVVTSDKNVTPLFAAANSFQWGVVSELISLKANVNIPDINYETVLHLAVSKGRVNIVEQLLKAGADINAPDTRQITPLGIAASKDLWDIVYILINEEANFNIKLGESKVTLLHYVARAGKNDLIELLLEKGAYINAVEEDSNYTPLTAAAQNQRWDTVIYLTEKGADLNAKACYNEERNLKFTALHFAAYYNGIDAAKALLSKKSLKIGEYENRFSVTFAEVAAKRNNWQIVLELINRGANITKPDKQNWTILHLAAEKNQLEIVETLLERKKEININAREASQNMTPIFIAALNNNWDIVEILMENGADVNIPDLGFRTVLYLAAEKNNAHIIELLLKKENIIIDSVESIKKATPLYIAAVNGHWRAARKLIEKGADVNMFYGKNKISLLHLAASSGNLEVVKALLDKGAEVNVKETDDDVTPVYAAAKNNHWDVVLELIKNGAQVNIPTKKNKETTVITLAVDNVTDEKFAEIMSAVDDAKANIFIDP